MWRCVTALAIIIVLFTVGNEDDLTVLGKTANSNQFNEDAWGIRFSSIDIENVELKWSCCYGGLLTKREVNELVEILDESQNKPLPFKGPVPKGGPTRLTIYLKSGAAYTFIPNGEYVLFNNYQMRPPELGNFMGRVKERIGSGPVQFSASHYGKVNAKMIVRVTDAGTEKAIRKARVTVIDRHGEVVLTELTDKDGRIITQIKAYRDPQFPTKQIGTITLLTVANGYNEQIFFNVPLNEWGENNEINISLRKVDPKIRNEPTILNSMAHRFTVFETIDYYAKELGLTRQPQIDLNSLQWGPNVK